MTSPRENAEPIPQPEEARCPYWGPWKSIAFAVGIFAICELLVGLVVVGVLISVRIAFPLSVDPWLQDAGLISLVTPLKAMLGLTLFIVVARLRGTTFASYFAVRLPSIRACGAWCIGAFVLIVLSDLPRVVSGRPVVPEWVSNLHAHAPSMTLLFVAVVVAAPLYEELLFRGLLLPGLACSRLGAGWSVLATSAVFALVHFQYDAYDMLTVFALGVFLSVARLVAGSTGIAILLHMLANFIGLAEAAVNLSFFDQ